MKVLVIDDHPLVREAVQQVLRRLDADVVVDSAIRCEQGFEIAQATADLDLVLLDLQLPGLSGIAALRAWRQRFASLPVVVMSATEERSAVLAALGAGAAGFIPKSTTNEVIISALELVLAGGKYVPPQAVAAASADDSRPARRRSTADTVESLGLTQRQLEVLRLIARGLPNKLICSELGLAERTVKAHTSALFRALHVSSRTQAALAAARLGLGP